MANGNLPPIPAQPIRGFAVASAFTALAALLIMKLYQVQVVETDRFDRLDTQQRMRTQYIPAPRGGILLVMAPHWQRILPALI